MQILHCLHPSLLIIWISLGNILLQHITQQLPYSMHQVTFLEQEECGKSRYELYHTGEVAIHGLIPCSWSPAANLCPHLMTSQQSIHFLLLEYGSSSPSNITMPPINALLCMTIKLSTLLQMKLLGWPLSKGQWGGAFQGHVLSHSMTFCALFTWYQFSPSWVLKRFQRNTSMSWHLMTANYSNCFMWINL